MNVHFGDCQRSRSPGRVASPASALSSSLLLPSVHSLLSQAPSLPRSFQQIQENGDERQSEADDVGQVKRECLSSVHQEQLLSA